MDYHLSIAGERSGPHTQFALIERIREGSLKGDELVWRLGINEWTSLKDMEEFNSYWPLSAETLASAELARQVARSELDRPQPWLRFWARVLDYFWFGMLAWVLISTLLPASALQWVIKTALMGVPLNSFILLLYVPLEAWLLSTRGTTPGKSLLRIQVRTLQGTLPSFQQALARSFQVFLKGVALWLPVVSLFAMTWWRLKLTQSGATAWDESNETRVEHGEPEIWRFLLLGGIIFVVALSVGVTMAMSKELVEAMRNLPK